MPALRKHPQTATKHLFVTGGVVSSLGKGLTASSLGQLLTARGLQVTGDATLLDRVLPGKGDAYHGQPQPAANGGMP